MAGLSVANSHKLFYRFGHLVLEDISGELGVEVVTCSDTWAGGHKFLLEGVKGQKVSTIFPILSIESESFRMKMYVEISLEMLRKAMLIVHIPIPALHPISALRDS